MKKIFGLSAVAFGLLATSCNPDDDYTPVCRMSTVVESSANGIRTTAITYDEGKISQLHMAGGTKSSKQFIYSGNNFTVVNKDDTGGITSKQDVALNNFYKISLITEKTPAGVVTKNTSYEYDNNGNLTHFTETPVTGTEKVTSFTFSNGNASSMLDANGNLTQLSYYTDKAFLDGDVTKVLQILGVGAVAVVNKNLIKSATVIGSPNKVTNITYEFDNAGKITKAILSGDASSTYTYTYDCK